MALRRIAALACALMTFALCSAGAQVRYRIIDLGTIPLGDDPSNDLYFPVRITEQSEILGLALGGNQFDQPWIWKASTGMIGLPLPSGASQGVGSGISPKGTVVGSSNFYSQGGLLQQATIWDADHSVRLLGPAPTYGSSAGDIAENGDVFGQFDFLPAVWGRDGSLTFLPISPNNPFGSANRVNKRGDVAGYKYAENTFIQTAVLWDRSRHLTTIGTLAGGSTIPFDLNDNGWVVGTSYLSFGPQASEAFFWSRATGLRKLPGLGASPEVTLAEGINNRGQIVGSSIPGNGFQFFTSGVIWQEGKVTDLNTLIEQPDHGFWFLSTADCINDRGEICGFADLFIDGQFSNRAVLLEPIHK